MSGRRFVGRLNEIDFQQYQTQMRNAQIVLDGLIARETQHWKEKGYSVEVNGDEIFIRDAGDKA